MTSGRLKLSLDTFVVKLYSRSITISLPNYCLFIRKPFYFSDRFISAIEKRYQASKVKLDEWVSLKFIWNAL
jgi:hypothetical protein